MNFKNSILLFIVLIFLSGSYGLANETEPSGNQSNPTVHPNLITDPKSLKPNSFRIGVMLPKSAFPENTEEIIAVTQFAQNEINRRGGILGEHLDLIYVDDERDGNKSKELLQYLTNEFGIHGLLGPSSTSRVQAISPLATVPVLTPNATGNDLNRQDENLIWRLMASNGNQAKQVANFLTYKKAKRIGIIFVDDVYGQNYLNELKQVLRKNDRIVTSEVSTPINVDFIKKNGKEIIQRSLQGDPDALVIIMTDSEYKYLAPFLAARVSDSKLKFVIGGEALYGSEVSKYIPANLLKCHFFTLPIQSLVVLRGIKSTFHRYRLKMIAYETPYFYDGVYLLSYARMIQKRNSSLTLKDGLNRVAKTVSSAGDNQLSIPLSKSMDLIAIKNEYSFEGIAGSYLFDENQDNIRAKIGFWLIKNNKLASSTRQSVQSCF